MPAIVTWLNPAGGDWDTASNWSGGQVPGSTDDVVINMPGVVVTHGTASTESVQSLTCQSPLLFSAGSLSVGGQVLLDGSSLSLAGSTALSAGSLVAQNAGVLTGSGDVAVSGGALVSGPGSSVSLDGLLSASWLRIENNGLLNESGSVSVFDGALIDAGSVTLSATNASATFSADELTLQDGSTLHDQGELVSARRIVLISGSSLSTSGNVAVTQVVLIDASTAMLNGSSLAVGTLESPGSLTVQNGGTLRDSGDLTLQGNALIQNAGNLMVQGAALVSGPWWDSGLTLTSNGSLSVGTLSLRGQGGAVLSIGSKASLAASALTLLGSDGLEIDGTLSVTNGIVIGSVLPSYDYGDVWLEGIGGSIVAGSLTVGNSSELSDSGSQADRQNLSVSGNVLVTGGSVELNFTRLSAAGLTVQNWGSFDTTGIASLSGNILISGQGARADFGGLSPVFSNLTADSLTVQNGGTLHIYDGDTSLTGTLLISDSTASIAPASLSAHGLTVTSSGSLDCTFGAMTATGAVVINGSTATVEDGGSLTVGTLQSPGSLAVENGSSLNDYDGGISLTGIALINHSTAGIDYGGKFSAAGLTVLNGGLFSDDRGSSVSLSGSALIRGVGSVAEFGMGGALKADSLIVQNGAELSGNGALISLSGSAVISSGDAIYFYNGGELSAAGLTVTNSSVESVGNLVWSVTGPVMFDDSKIINIGSATLSGMGLVTATNGSEWINVGSLTLVGDVGFRAANGTPADFLLTNDPGAQVLANGDNVVLGPTNNEGTIIIGPDGGSASIGGGTAVNGGKFVGGQGSLVFYSTGQDDVFGPSSTIAGPNVSFDFRDFATRFAVDGTYGVGSSTTVFSSGPDGLPDGTASGSVIFPGTGAVSGAGGRGQSITILSGVVAYGHTLNMVGDLTFGLDLDGRTPGGTLRPGTDYGVLDVTVSGGGSARFTGTVTVVSPPTNLFPVEFQWTPILTELTENDVFFAPAPGSTVSGDQPYNGPDLFGIQGFGITFVLNGQTQGATALGNPNAGLPTMVVPTTTTAESAFNVVPTGEESANALAPEPPALETGEGLGSGGGGGAGGGVGVILAGGGDELALLLKPYAVSELDIARSLLPGMKTWAESVPERKGSLAPLVPTLPLAETGDDESGRGDANVPGDSPLLDCLMDLGATKPPPGAARPAAPRESSGRSAPAPVPAPAGKGQAPQAGSVAGVFLRELVKLAGSVLPGLLVVPLLGSRGPSDGERRCQRGTRTKPGPNCR